jgi:hypothetical protein
MIEPEGGTTLTAGGCTLGWLTAGGFTFTVGWITVVVGGCTLGGTTEGGFTVAVGG